MQKKKPTHFFAWLTQLEFLDFDLHLRVKGQGSSLGMVMGPNLNFGPTNTILISRALTRIFGLWVGFEPKFFGLIKFRVRVGLNLTWPYIYKKKIHTHSLAHITTLHMHTAQSHEHASHAKNTHISQSQNQITNRASTKPTNPKLAVDSQHRHCQLHPCHAAATSCLLQSTASCLPLASISPAGCSNQPRDDMTLTSQPTAHCLTILPRHCHTRSRSMRDGEGLSHCR